MINVIRLGESMSHSAKITLIADQEIKILGEIINIHDINTLVLDENGKIKQVYYTKKKEYYLCENERPQEVDGV